MTEAAVHRCANCGAPLEGGAEATVVPCLYCRAENHLTPATSGAAGAQVARLQLAAEEADAIAARNEERSEALMAEFQELSMKAHQGDQAAAKQALVAMEGYLRLQYAPTVHIYQSWDPNDPTVVKAMKQIDDAVAQALTSTAEGLGLRPADES